eukprot:365713-Chlamydomonas_euryale.AAC.9
MTKAQDADAGVDIGGASRHGGDVERRVLRQAKCLPTSRPTPQPAGLHTWVTKPEMHTPALMSVVLADVVATSSGASSGRPSASRIWIIAMASSFSWRSGDSGTALGTLSTCT